LAPDAATTPGIRLWYALVGGRRCGSRDLITLATKIRVSGSWLRIWAISDCSFAAASAGESPTVMLFVPACRSTMSGR
jgi:hypothetical protein